MPPRRWRRNSRGRRGNLTLTAPLGFQPSYLGLKNIYMLAMDSGNGNTGWQSVGTFTVQPPPALRTPLAWALTPVSGSGTTGTFTATFRHTGGASKHYLGYTLFLPTPNVVSFDAQGTCLIEYNRISNGMRLINDAGNGWTEPAHGVPVAAGTAPLTRRAQ
jgi:hypothetical protein